MAMRDPDDLQHDHDITTEDETIESGAKEMPCLQVEENSKDKPHCLQPIALKLLHETASKSTPPERSKQKETTDHENEEIEDLVLKASSILFNLTPETFQTSVSQMRALHINTESRLRAVVNLIFEKASSEPNFSAVCANMCRCLSMYKAPSESRPGESVNFRAVLLTRVQREFESSTKTKMEQQNEDESEHTNADAIKRVKQRYLGNIRFLGELFKLKMLTVNIIHDCIFKLLRSKDPDYLECVCCLLTIVGKHLDTPKAKPRLYQYFGQLTKIANNNNTPPRLQSLIQDVVDLWKNNWERTENNLSTADLVKQDAAREAQARAVHALQHPPQRKAVSKTEKDLTELQVRRLPNPECNFKISWTETSAAK